MFLEDAELGTMRTFLRSRNGQVSSVRELEALLIKLGYQSSAAALMDAMQESSGERMAFKRCFWPCLAH